MGNAAQKVDTEFRVFVTLDVSMAPDVPFVVQDLEDFIRDSIDLEFQPDEVEVELMEVDDYYA